MVSPTRQAEMDRIGALKREFANDRAFLLKALIHGWSILQARDRYRIESHSQAPAMVRQGAA